MFCLLLFFFTLLYITIYFTFYFNFVSKLINKFNVTIYTICINHIHQTITSQK